MKIARAIWTTWGLLIFALAFLLLLPFLFIPIYFPRQFKLTGILNRWWAYLLLIFTGIPFTVECRSKLDRKRQYIFCPNHFSYLDIPAMGLNPINTVFVGKKLGYVPFFSFMYDRLHILVDRTRLKSRSASISRSLQAIDEGKSLVIFAEGGMITSHPPRMEPFKDGAFRVAIEKQIPLVPVTIPFNWVILPDSENLLHRGKLKVIFHEPIETKGMTQANLADLKEKTFFVIDNELKKQNKRREDR
jgi:1-acyl-sn-glycerol-3-phosphate acyltransferase